MLSTRKINLRQFLIYLGVTAFSVLFTVVYYMNSYGMTDNHLTYLFVAPLLTSLMFLLMLIFNYSLNVFTRYTINMTFPFVYLYMMLSGIYTIAKATSTWLYVFLIAFIIGLVVAIIIETITKIRARAL